MSDFVANIARRGAGLPPMITPRDPAPDFDTDVGASPEVQTDVMPSPKRDTVARPAAVSLVQNKGTSEPVRPSETQPELRIEPKERTMTETTQIEKVERVVEPTRSQPEIEPEIVSAKPVEPVQAPIVPSSTLSPTRTEIEGEFEPSEKIQREVEAERADELVSTTRAVVESLAPREPEPWEATLPSAPERSNLPQDSTEPKVEVHIGQIELRVTKTPTPRPARPTRTPSLDEHTLTRSYLDRIY